MSRVSRAFAAFALTACTFGTGLAHADTAATTAARKAASDRYHHGIELYKRATQTQDAADFERAYLEFAQAYSIYPDDKVLWNLGASELETKRFLAALRHFRLYDAHLHVSDNAKHPDHAKLATYLDRSYGATGHLDIKAPAGAHLSIDGADAGVAPLADIVDVEAGTHQVASDAETRSTDAGAGQLVRIVFAGSATASAAVPSSPPAPSAAPPASNATGSPTNAVPEATHGGGPPVGAWALAGIGVVGIGVGVGFAIDGGSKNDAVAKTHLDPDDHSSSAYQNVQTETSARSRDRVIAIAGAVGGSASIVAAGVVWWISSHARTADKMGSFWLAPSVGSRTTGFELGSSF